jgi:hypothetical protein
MRDCQSAVEQFNGREGETATFLWRCPLNFGGLGGDFAPRHLNRCSSSKARINQHKRAYQTRFVAGVCRRSRVSLFLRTQAQSIVVSVLTRKLAS